MIPSVRLPRQDPRTTGPGVTTVKGKQDVQATMKKGSCVGAVAVGPGGLELLLVEGAADKHERDHRATEREDRIG